MSKMKLASKLADELGVTIAKASRYIDDVGASRAQRTLDEMAQAGDRTLSKWARPALLTGGAIGGGALIWRQQDVEEAQALAEQQQTYRQTIRDLIESDLPPDLKKELAKAAAEAAQDGDNGDDGGGDGGLVPDDPATLVILLIVLALTLRYALGESQ